MSKLDLIYSKLKHLDFKKSQTPIDEKIVISYQDEVGILFPEDFYEYLLNFGRLNFDGQDFYGITANKNGGLPDLISATKIYREDYLINKFMIPIVSTGYGGLYVIDTSIKNEKNESPVVIVEYPIDDDFEKEIITNNFYDFLLESLDSAIEKQ
ncbi:MAG: SMI1/KNR4 family protein [Lonepinella koalarum]|nr:SMI1/KNR4 family protein [Lonepinella koalarum]